MINNLRIELVSGAVVPPVLTGLWLIFVYINNRVVEHKGRGSRIEQHPWLNLIHGYLVILGLFALDYFQR
jgi:hypothetical protein